MFFTIHVSRLTFFTSLLFLLPEFFRSAPYHEKLLLKYRSISCILSGDRSSDSDSSNEPVKHSLVKGLMRRNRLQPLMQHAFLHTSKPLLHVFFAWLLLILLP